MKMIRTVACLLIVFVLSSCRSSLLADLTTGHGERFFWDDFTEPSGQWPVYTTDDGAYAPSDGEYHISVTTPFYQMWALSGHAYRDVQIEADATRLEGPLANLYGLICRATDKVNFYFFIISSDGYYAIGKMSDNETSLLGQEMMAFNAVIAPGEGINHLRFDCIGSTLTGYINGQMVALTDDTSFQDGDAGLITGSFDEGGVEVSFDNFVVYKP